MSTQPIVPEKYAGKWIAWNEDHTKIIGSGRTFREVRTAMKKKGKEASFAKAPPANTTFIGNS